MNNPILSVSHVRKAFGGLVAVNDVSFDVQAGEVIGLMGPNGAGKTTMMNLLSGAYKPDNGSIRYNGNEIGGLPPHKICRSGIARTYQIPQPFTNMTVRENLLVAALYGQKKISRTEIDRQLDTLFEMTRFPSRQDASCQQFTTVTLKKIELMRALASNPTLLLLDEVAAGSTEAELPQILEIIKNMRAMGKTIIMVEHIIKFMVEAVDRIVVMEKGAKIAEGQPAEIMKNEAVITAYLC
jgi:branched-chain amino acid transport system ATP-binding protein